MRENKQRKDFIRYILLAIATFFFICIDYHFFATNLVSIEIYSLILSILGGTFFLFLQKAYSVTYEEAVKKLSAIPEIENLCQIAEEKKVEIEDLESEKAKLEHIIEVSAKKYYLEKRYRELERRLKNTYDELISIKKEIRDLNIEIDGTLVGEKIEKIEKFIKHRERGDFVIRIGNRRFVIPQSLLDTYPLGGLGLLILSISEIHKAIEKIFER